MNDSPRLGPYDWQPDQIPDLTGLVTVVTGASSGLGKVAARTLAHHGATVVMAVRDVRKGEEVRASFGTDIADRLDVRALDLFDLTSVRRFADDLLGDHAAVDVLLNNAGVGNEPYRVSSEGVEGIFATNVVGHFALTSHLMQALERSQAGRVVSVSSLLYRRVKVAMPLDDPAPSMSALKRYTASKLGNLMLAEELERRLRSAGTGVRSLAAHPGVAATPMAERQADSAGQRFLGRVVHMLVGRSAEAGAIPLLFAATAPEAPTGVLLGPGIRKRDLRIHAEVVRPPADDLELARRLWRFLEDKSGVRMGLDAGSLHS